jgi:hypothetical protein
VKREEVGSRFPFDRVYLLRHEDRAAIERLFRVALVLPVDADVKRALNDLAIDEVVVRGHARNDRESAPRKVKEGALEQLLDDDCVLAVPILARWSREWRDLSGGGEEKRGREAPRYLTSPKWLAEKRKRERAGRRLLSNYAYLQLPGRKVRPVCAICPRFIAHQTGECQPGNEPDCYRLLALGTRSYWNEGLRAGRAGSREAADGIVRPDGTREHGMAGASGIGGTAGG